MEMISANEIHYTNALLLLEWSLCVVKEHMIQIQGIPNSFCIVTQYIFQIQGFQLQGIHLAVLVDEGVERLDHLQPVARHRHISGVCINFC